MLHIEYEHKCKDDQLYYERHRFLLQDSGKEKLFYDNIQIYQIIPEAGRLKTQKQFIIKKNSHHAEADAAKA